MPGKVTYNSINLGESDEDDRDRYEDEHGVEIDDDEIDHLERRREGNATADQGSKNKLKSKTKIEAAAMNGGEPAKDGEKQVEKKKRVLGPRAKLDTTRLCGPLGLPALVQDFSHINWKGKGHELENFRVMMRKMENWAHGMYPKFKFDDVLEKVEVLGSKKEVKTCVKKLLMDMPVLPEDFVSKPIEIPSVQPLFGNAAYFPQKLPIFSSNVSNSVFPENDFDVDLEEVDSTHPAAHLAQKLQPKPKLSFEYPTDQEMAEMEALHALNVAQEKDQFPQANNSTGDTLNDYDDMDFDGDFQEPTQEDTKKVETIGMDEALALLQDED